VADKKIDPRFDPAFQRGYAAGGKNADSAQAARGVEAHRSAAVTQVQSSTRAPSSPSFTPPENPPSTPSAPTSSHNGYDPKPEAHYLDDDGSVVAAMPAATRTSLGRNPWIYVLWVLGASLLSLGTYGLWWAINGLYGGGNLGQEEWMLFSLSHSAAPVFITAGSLFTAAALVVHALDWRRKNA